MGIALYSSDAEAGTLLTSALRRRAVHCDWFRDTQRPPNKPLVLVVDAELDGYETVLARFQSTTAWGRAYVLAQPGAGLEGQPAPLVIKPFDASQLAEQLKTEHRLAQMDRVQRSVARRAEELTRVVQTSFEAIVGLDEQWQVVFWNEGAESTYGFRAEEALGRHLDELLGVQEVNAPGADLQRHTFEQVRRHCAGHEITVMATRFRPGQAGDENHFPYAELSLDITQTRRLRDELLHSQRLAHLGRISASMSHEINNPLAVIRSCSAWLGGYAQEGAADGVPLDLDSEEVAEAARDLDAASERIATFVDQMCGFARKKPLELRRAPLAGTLELALRMVRPRAQSKKVELCLEDSSGVTMFFVHDSSRLAQALINVLANAVDAAAEGGQQVRIRAHGTEADLLVEVEDNGPGVPEALRDRVFEPFVTTKPYGQGTGLGLALTREVLAEHGGSVSLEPAPAAGTCARLRVPINGASRAGRQA